MWLVDTNRAEALNRRWVHNTASNSRFSTDLCGSCTLFFRLGAVASAIIYITLASMSISSSCVVGTHDLLYLTVFAAVRTCAIWDQNKKVFWFLLCTGLIYPALALVSTPQTLRQFMLFLTLHMSLVHSSQYGRLWRSISRSRMRQLCHCAVSSRVLPALQTHRYHVRLLHSCLHTHLISWRQS